MASPIDLPLDDVIQAQQKSKQGRGGAAGGPAGGGKGGGARGGGKGGRGKGVVRKLQGSQVKAPTWRVWGMPPKTRAGGVGGPVRMAPRQGGVAGAQRKAGAVAKDGSKLDMALEEVITKEWTGGKKGGGKGEKDGRTVVRTAYRAPAASGWQKGKGRYVGSQGGGKGGKGGGKVGRVTRQVVPWTRTKPGVKFIRPRNLAVARGRYFASSAGASKASYLASKDGGYAAARQGKGGGGGERIIRTRAVVSIPPSLRPRPVTVRTKGGKGSSGTEGLLGKGGDRGVAAAAVWRKASLRPAWHEHDDREGSGGGGWKSHPQDSGWSKNGRGGADDERRPLTQRKQWPSKRGVSALVQASQAAAGWKNNWAPPARQFAEDHQRSSWRRELERQPPQVKQQRYSWRAEEEDDEEEDEEDEESEEPPPQRSTGGGQRRRKVQEVEDERPRRRVYRPAPREAAPPQQRPALREPLQRSGRVVRNSVSGTGGGARSAAPAARAASPSPPRRRNQQPQQQQQREARQKTAGPASRQQPTSRQRGRAESQYADDPPARGPPQRQAQKRSRYEDDDEDADRRLKRVRVSNIPRDLDPRDIKDAFEEETGKVMSCEVQRGTAWLTYRNSDGAKKAVETFNRGELNGNIIEVSIED